MQVQGFLPFKSDKSGIDKLIFCDRILVFSKPTKTLRFSSNNPIVMKSTTMIFVSIFDNLTHQVVLV